MADFIVNEELCWVFYHFGSVPNDYIAVILSTFYAEEELMKAKTVTHDFCENSTHGVSVPRIITRRGENRLALDAEDILKYFTLLE